MGAKRKSYTPAYRRDAAHLVIDTGRTIAEVAREIGVGEQRPVANNAKPRPAACECVSPAPGCRAAAEAVAAALWGH